MTSQERRLQEAELRCAQQLADLRYQVNRCKFNLNRIFWNDNGFEDVKGALLKKLYPKLPREMIAKILSYESGWMDEQEFYIYN